MYLIFRKLKFAPDAEIGRLSADFEKCRFQIGSIEIKSFPWYTKKRKLDGVAKSPIYCIEAVFQILGILHVLPHPWKTTALCIWNFLLSHPALIQRFFTKPLSTTINPGTRKWRLQEYSLMHIIFALKRNWAKTFYLTRQLPGW